MDDINQIANAIFQDFISQAQEQGLTITKVDEETGGIYIPNATGETMVVRLDNLIHYYYESRDENAVSDFVAKIVDMAKPQQELSWEEAKEDIFIGLYPITDAEDRPFAKDITGYFYRHFIIDNPNQSACVMMDMAEKWGVTEEELEKQAHDNANKLLAQTFIEIGDVEGHPLGSFNGNESGVRDRTIVGALLFAPDLKAKLSKDFGWPLYAVIPDKVTCYFFGKDHFDYFEARIGNLVAEKYDDSRYITPELLELSDEGVKTICSWTMQTGRIIKFNGG